MRILRGICLSVLLYFVIAPGAAGLQADRMILKSGIHYYDVLTRPTGKSHRVRFAHGRTILIPNHTIRFLRISPVSWGKKKNVRNRVRRQRIRQNTRRGQKQPLRHRGDAPQALRPLHLIIVGPGEEFPVNDYSARQLPVRSISMGIEENGRSSDSPSAGEHISSDALNYRPDGDGGRSFFFSIPTLTPFLRSLILPGWGQYSIGQKVRGSLFFASALIVLGRYVEIYRSHSEAEKKYNDPGTTLAIGVAAPGVEGLLWGGFYLQRIKSDVSRLETKGNDTLWMLGFVWLLNVADIIRTQELETFSLQASLKSSSVEPVTGTSEEETLQIGWRIRF